MIKQYFKIKRIQERSYKLKVLYMLHKLDPLNIQQIHDIVKLKNFFLSYFYQKDSSKYKS